VACTNPSLRSRAGLFVRVGILEQPDRRIKAEDMIDKKNKGLIVF
jgi:hypothetical protein